MVPFRYTYANWLFIDMNSFFASAEQHLRPELRGRPVGVIPVETDSTCCIAASIDAKRVGVRVGTPVREARRMCPGIVLVKARPDVYVRLHHQIAASIDRWVPIHKAYSIDEWAARLTGPERDIERATEIGASIKRQVYADFSPHLGCSVGVAPTRLLAKIACELQKPDGLTVLTTDDLPHRLEHLGLEDLTGIASGTAGRLRRYGVRTVADLWALTRAEAVEAWGSVVGGAWWAGFHGIDEPEQRTRKRTMSHENVLEPRFRTDDGARLMLTRLTHRLGVRLRDGGLVTSRLTVRVRWADDAGGFADEEPLEPTQDTRGLLDALRRVWSRYPVGLGVPLKAGVTVSRLDPATTQGEQLFFTPSERNTAISRAMDAINTRHALDGRVALHYGSMVGCAHQMDDKIAFGRIPPALSSADDPGRGPPASA